MEKKYNLRSPAVKRLMREARELCEPTEQYFAQPVEDNLFEWHFTVQGPADSDFENGRYHGRITLPPEYPMKPPSIILLTPNGRFETGKKICLSMSAHHPETWQPSWSIRTVLLAIIGFMPTKGGGAIGALDYTSEERKILAKKSIQWKCNICNSCNSNVLKQDFARLISFNFSHTLQAEPGSPRTKNEEAEELAAKISFKGENEKRPDDSVEIADGVTSVSNTSNTGGSVNVMNNEDINSPDTTSSSFGEPSGILNDETSRETGVSTADKATVDSTVRKRVSKRSSVKRNSRQTNNNELLSSTGSSSGRLSTSLILVLTTCLFLLLLRRIYREYYTKSS